VIAEFVVEMVDKISEPAKRAIESLSELVLESNALGVSGEETGGVFEKLSGFFSENAFAIGAVVSAALAAAGVLAKLSYEGSKLALEATDASEDMKILFGALSDGAFSGEDAVKMLDDLSHQTGKTRAALAPLAQAFMAMGIRDLPKLNQALLASASASALAGEGGADAFKTLTAKIQEAVEAGKGLKLADKQLANLYKTGISVADVAKKMGVSQEELTKQLSKGTANARAFGDALQAAIIEKGAGPLEHFANNLGQILDIAKQRATDLFIFGPAQTGIDNFLSGLKDMLSIFDVAKPSGQALKAAITGALNSIFQAAAKVFPYIKKFALDLVIVGLKIYIAFKPVVAKFKELFSGKTAGDVFGTMLVRCANMLIIVGEAAARGAMMILKIVEVWQTVSAALSNAESIGSNFIAGLVAGITGGLGDVVSAASGIGQAAEGALKSALGIASPSKVMLEAGAHTAGGFAKGIAAGTGAVADAGSGMGAAASAGPSAAAPASGASNSSKSITIDVGGIHIDGSGKSASEITEEMVSTIFERMALQVGL